MAYDWHPVFSNKLEVQIALGAVHDNSLAWIMRGLMLFVNHASTHENEASK